MIKKYYNKLADKLLRIDQAIAACLQTNSRSRQAILKNYLPMRKLEVLGVPVCVVIDPQANKVSFQVENMNTAMLIKDLILYGEVEH